MASLFLIKQAVGVQCSKCHIDHRGAELFNGNTERFTQNLTGLIINRTLIMFP